MDFLRRSMHTKELTSNQISTPITSISRPTPSTQPPSKVIRALDDYRSQAPQELSFQKGDFFHVSRDINGWYEANNPITGARGLVPKSRFEEFNKSNAAQRISQAAARLPLKSPTIRSGPASPRQQVFYAVVQHDFLAERADELDAKGGDHISVVAQSNFEWFVGKPISRLGRPGLIPVSFVAIHDPGTGRAMSEDEVRNLMERGDIPNVEEWKRSIMDYKAASISLGTIDDDGRGVPNSPYAPASAEQPVQELYEPPPPQEPPRPSTPPTHLPPGMIVSAEIVSWHFENDEYWFRVNALYQPDDPYGSNTLPPARQLILYRVYSDFYAMQVGLKNAFPVEAGDKPGRPGEHTKRILPFMPSPAIQVDDEVTSYRKDELHGYVVQLCSLWEFGAEYMLRDRAIRDFFSPRAGDSEEEVESATWILDGRQTKKYTPIQEDAEEEQQMGKSFAGLTVQDDYKSNRLSEGSHYDDETAVGRPSTDSGFSHSRKVASPPPRDYFGREDNYGRSHSPFTSSTARTQSPMPAKRVSGSSSRNYSAEAAIDRSTSARSPSHWNEPEQVISYVSKRRPSDESPRSFSSIPSHPPSSGSTLTGRSRSQSNANAPPISATNSNPAFVKIKIFDRLTQDLIAIRVNPRVTHEQLMDKVKARLGEDVRQLAFRNSISNTFSSISDDIELKDWLENTDKHVLYAD